MEVKLISITTEAEKIISYCARVSNPANQDNPDYAKLLKYCLDSHHVSIFEMANCTVEITTSRAIAAQILRHKSFSFQELSQRYAKVSSVEEVVPRRQDTKNRQNSIDDLPKETIDWFNEITANHNNNCMELYNSAIERGIAKECARFLLPLSTTTKLYMNGTIRSWIHYIQLRTGSGTQKEHMDVANAIKGMIKPHFPIISSVLGW